MPNQTVADEFCKKYLMVDPETGTENHLSCPAYLNGECLLAQFLNDNQ